MNRHFSVKMLLSIVLIIFTVATLFCITTAAEGETTETWTRVTSVDQLLEGGTFIFGYEATADSGIIVPMANEGSASLTAAGFLYSGKTAESGNDDTIDMSAPGDTSKFEVTVAASTVTSGAITIKAAEGFIGYNGSSNKAKLFKADSADNGTAFTPVIGDNDVISLTNGNASCNTLSYNTGSPRFACYGGTQKILLHTR